jgi:hypothetical protein
MFPYLCAQVLEEIQNKRKAYENSTMGKLSNFGNTLSKMVGGEGSESEPESDVSIMQAPLASV